MDIHLFGAASGIGRWFVEHAFAPPQKIFAYDINAQALETLPDTEDIIPVPLPASDDLPFKPDTFKRDDAVLLAVPEAQLPALCRSLKPALPEGICVAVMTSRQADPVADVSNVLADSNVIGLHPLFGPHVISAYGQTVVCCQEDEAKRQGSSEGALEAALTATGMRVIYKNPVAHDSDMAYVQTLTHFILLAFSDFLGASDKKIEDLMEMRTPPFQFLTAFAFRMLMQSPDTSAAIQNAANHQQVRKDFLDTVQELHALFSRNDPEQSAKKILSIKEHFSLSMLQDWMHYSELAVSALQEREKFFSDQCRHRALVVFRTKDTPRDRVGFIDAVKDFSLEFTEFITRIEESGKVFIPCAVNDAAIEAYKKKGIHIKTQTRLKIKKEHLEVVSDVDTWLENNMLPVQEVQTFLNPMGLTEAFVTAWLPNLFGPVQDCQCVSVYQDLLGHARMTLAITLCPTVSMVQLKEDIQTFLQGEPPG